jgi:hypothetical protein
VAGARRKGRKRKNPGSAILFPKKTDKNGTLLPVEKPIGAAEALRIVADLVRTHAGEIAAGAIDKAKRGELAHTRYLYELAGIHPPSPETAESKPEDSPTYKWLTELASAAERGKEAIEKGVSGEGIL